MGTAIATSEKESIQNFEPDLAQPGRARWRHPNHPAVAETTSAGVNVERLSRAEGRGCADSQALVGVINSGGYVLVLSASILHDEGDGHDPGPSFQACRLWTNAACRGRFPNLTLATGMK